MLFIYLNQDLYNYLFFVFFFSLRTNKTTMIDLSFLLTIRQETFSVCIHKERDRQMQILEKHAPVHMMVRRMTLRHYEDNIQFNMVLYA